MKPDSNRAAIERSLRRRLYAVAFGGMLMTTLLELVLAIKTASPTTLVAVGTVCALSISVTAIAIVLNVRKRLRPFADDFSAPPDKEEQRRLKGSIRTLVVYELLLVLALVYGVAESEGLSWPLLIGCGMSLLIQSMLLRMILRLRKRLRLAATHHIQ